MRSWPPLCLLCLPNPPSSPARHLVSHRRVRLVYYLSTSLKRPSLGTKQRRLQYRGPSRARGRARGCIRMRSHTMSDVTVAGSDLGARAHARHRQRELQLAGPILSWLMGMGPWPCWRHGDTTVLVAEPRYSELVVGRRFRFETIADGRLHGAVVRRASYPTVANIICDRVGVHKCRNSRPIIR